MNEYHEPGHGGSSEQISDTTSSPGQLPQSKPAVVKHCRDRIRKPVPHVAEHDELTQVDHEQYGHGSRIQSMLCVSMAVLFVSQH